MTRGKRHIVPVRRGESVSRGARSKKVAELSELQNDTIGYAVSAANRYLASLKGTPEELTNRQWCDDISLYLNHLVIGSSFPDHAKKRLGEETRRLAREWVDAACRETGLKLPGK